MKNQFRIKNLPFPVENADAVCKSYVDSGLNHTSIIRNTAHVDFNDENLDNVRFVKVNSLPAVSQHLTPKHYVDDAIDEISLVRNNQDNNFNLFNFTNINSFTSNTQTVNDKQVITKSYVDHFRQENEQSRRDLRIDFYNESSDLVKNNQDNNFNLYKLTKLNSVTVNGEPNSDYELANKKYIDGELKIHSSNLIKHWKTISKSLLETMFMILLNMINYKLQIQQLWNILAVEDVYYINGI